MTSIRPQRFAAEDMSSISLGDARCNKCRHVFIDGLTCGAFPQGIPNQILGGHSQHRKPFPGDHGIRFEPREKT